MMHVHSWPSIWHAAFECPEVGMMGVTDLPPGSFRSMQLAPVEAAEKNDWKDGGRGHPGWEGEASTHNMDVCHVPDLSVVLQVGWPHCGHFAVQVQLLAQVRPALHTPRLAQTIKKENTNLDYVYVYMNRLFLAKPGVIEARSHNVRPSRALENGTPDPDRLACSGIRGKGGVQHAIEHTKRHPGLWLRHGPHVHLLNHEPDSFSTQV